MKTHTGNSRDEIVMRYKKKMFIWAAPWSKNCKHSMLCWSVWSQQLWLRPEIPFLSSPFHQGCGPAWWHQCGLHSWWPALCLGPLATHTLPISLSHFLVVHHSSSSRISHSAHHSNHGRSTAINHLDNNYGLLIKGRGVLVIQAHIVTFMKMASPLGTLTNMSPPTCSTPAYIFIYITPN